MVLNPSSYSHNGKGIRRFAGIYAYCRYFIKQKWYVQWIILTLFRAHPAISHFVHLLQKLLSGYKYKSLAKSKSWVVKNWHICKICIFRHAGLGFSKMAFIILSLFRNVPYLTICPLENFFTIFCRLLIFFKIKLFEKFFQEYHQSVKQFWSRSDRTFCQPWSGSKLFAKVFSRRR